MTKQPEPTLDLTALLERSRRLDRYALEDLHDLLYPLVYRYVLFRLTDLNISREITTQIFQNFLKVLTKRKQPKGQPLIWLIHMAEKHVSEFHEPTTKSNTSPEKQTPDGKIEEANYEDVSQVDKIISGAIQQLKPLHQHVLALRFTTQASLEQTALLMDQPIRRVRRLQWQALQSLHHHLEMRNRE